MSKAEDTVDHLHQYGKNHWGQLVVAEMFSLRMGNGGNIPAMLSSTAFAQVGPPKHARVPLAQPHKMNVYALGLGQGPCVTANHGLPQPHPQMRHVIGFGVYAQGRWRCGKRCAYVEAGIGKHERPTG